jgi:hypothetical protein
MKENNDLMETLQKKVDFITQLKSDLVKIKVVSVYKNDFFSCSILIN